MVPSSMTREEYDLALAQMVFDRVDHTAQVRVLGYEALDLVNRADHGRVVLAPESTTDLGIACPGEFARQVHGYHARTSHSL